MFQVTVYKKHTFLVIFKYRMGKVISEKKTFVILCYLSKM